MMTLKCPYCGCMHVEYLGVDAGGEYEDQLCDMFRCPECEGEFEGHCVDVESDEDDDGLDKRGILDFLSTVGFLRRIWGTT